jgi:AraC-like DNA-binding protein
MDYIESHLQEPLTVRMLSQKLGISESHLSTIFKKEIGRALTIKFNLKRSVDRRNPASL